jgi:hypothetical protein
MEVKILVVLMPPILMISLLKVAESFVCLTVTTMHRTHSGATCIRPIGLQLIITIINIMDLL